MNCKSVSFSCCHVRNMKFAFELKLNLRGMEWCLKNYEYRQSLKTFRSLGIWAKKFYFWSWLQLFQVFYKKDWIFVGRLPQEAQFIETRNYHHQQQHHNHHHFYNSATQLIGSILFFSKSPCLIHTIHINMMQNCSVFCYKQENWHNDRRHYAD